MRPGSYKQRLKGRDDKDELGHGSDPKSGKSLTDRQNKIFKENIARQDTIPIKPEMHYRPNGTAYWSGLPSKLKVAPTYSPLTPEMVKAGHRDFSKNPIKR